MKQDLTPFDILFNATAGEVMPLPGVIADLFGELRFPEHVGHTYVVSNFVESLDGIVTLAEPGSEGGGEISGNNRHDRFMMGLLRACADAVVITSRSLEVNANALWTAQDIFPPAADGYSQLRREAGMAETPLHVVVTRTGELNRDARLFQTAGMDVLVITTEEGAGRLAGFAPQANVRVQTVVKSGLLKASHILDAIQAENAARLVLTEAGPSLTAYFIEEQLLDELFLTLSPQVVGREAQSGRLGFNVGKHFAPGSPRWGSLVSVRKAGEHLFLRYSFNRQLRNKIGVLASYG